MLVLVCSEDGRWSSGVDKDVVFLKFLDVSFNLVHLGLEGLLATLFADGIKFLVVGLLLVVSH